MVQKVLYTAVWTILWLYAWLLLSMDIRRHCKLPAGSKIFVSNHPSATDPFMIHILSRQQMNVLITAKAFTVPVFGWFLRKVREIPVPLEQGSIALEHASRYIQNGKSVAIFIEGHTSPLDGSFLPRVQGLPVWHCRPALRSSRWVFPCAMTDAPRSTRKLMANRRKETGIYAAHMQ